MDDVRVPGEGAPARSAPPTTAQDQAVIGWLATRPALPNLTRDLLIDALIFWEPLAPLPVVTAAPISGADADTRQLLHAIARRLRSHPCHADEHQTQCSWPTSAAYSAWTGTPDPDPDGARARRRRWEQHLDWITQLRVLETDTAVDLALADSRRERGQ
jgi:hypothetical protein